MFLNQKIVTARKLKGLTQEELSEMSKVTVRTIQRIESGKGTPSTFTLKSITTALEIPFEEQITILEDVNFKNEEAKHFLTILYLSCFSYLIIPYIHFLVPYYLSKRRKEQHPIILLYARKIVLNQIYWIVGTLFVFLLALGYNFFQAIYLNKKYPLNYMLVFFAMYLINALIIMFNLRHLKTKKIF
ncbi:helix-turn-helix domain-containing protein [Flavobacterium sp.]|uniref:helix-turn-helix domain-containing protein n=1 Tax=Flavobacterium sp. TaxID=239 RepID=UPI00286E34E3|nr:helix-turn-helix domain-containing protein [Flavobacterium sp.]